MFSSNRYLPLAATMVFSLAASACTSGSGDPVTPLPGSGDINTGQNYPAAPYGGDVGNVIKNFVFPGYGRPDTGFGDAKHNEVTLGDFYNPDGDGTFPEDGEFAHGEPLPRALVIILSAVWCGPCKYEAQNILPGEYDHFKPLGGEIMAVLVDAVDPGDAADFDNLDAWVSTYEPAYPSVIDPDGNMSTVIDTSSFPSNFIIDTKDMTIVEIVKGSPQESFWSKLESLLAETQ